MKTQRKQSNLRNALTAGALGLAAIAGNSYGQDTPKLEDQGKLELRLRSAAVERQGFTTQDDFVYKKGDYTLKGLIEVLPNGKESNYGLDLSSKDFRLNLGYGDRKENDLSRFAFTYYPEHDSSKSFIGGNVEFLADETRFIGIGGLELTDKLFLEGTADNRGNARVALFPKLGNATLGVGLGRNEDGDFDANFSYNTDHVWANVKFGENRPLDARLVVGKIDKDFSRYVSSVTGQGDNELDVFADQTFKFDTANGFFNYFGVGNFVGHDQGDWAVDLRYQEDKRVQANFGYRIGDLGFMKDAMVGAGVYHDFVNDVNGFNVQTGFNLNDNPRVNVRFRADVNEKDTTLGAFLELKF